MHTGIVLHVSNQSPVGCTGVHLGAGAAMNRQRRNAAILQLLGKRYNNLRLVVPSQAGLHGYRLFDRLHHLRGNIDHQLRSAQHARSGAFTGDFLYRTTEINIDDVRSGFFTNLSSFDHRRRIATINLYGYRTFLFTNSELFLCFLHIANQRIARHELGIHHIRPKSLTKQPEPDIGHIFHRSKENRISRKINSAYLHLFTICTRKTISLLGYFIKLDLCSVRMFVSIVRH